MIIKNKARFADIQSLYRAKAVGDRQGNWIEGYYVRGILREDGYNKITHMMYSDYVEMLTTNRIPVYDWCVPVDEYTVRVFTGIFISDSVRLWEGDYVLYQDSVYVVRYDASKGSFYLHNPSFPDYEDKYYIYLSTLSFMSRVNLRVIGNDVDDDFNDLRDRYKSLFDLDDREVNGYYIEIDAELGGKVFALYDFEDREVGRYLIGDHQIVGYELCLGDMGYVQYDEFLRRKMEDELMG